MTLGTDLHVDVRGAGETVLFVHASFGDGTQDWVAQRPLADRYRMLLLDRRGYGDSPPRATPATCDVRAFDTQAQEIADLLGEGAHLVGHSYGGLLSLLAAVCRPDAVRSLTVIEPPAYGIARGHPDVDAVVARLAPVYAAVPQLTPEDFRDRIFAALGFVDPRPLSPRQRKNVEATMAEPPGWTATVPLDRLAQAGIPTLVVSGGWGGATDSARDTAGRACTVVCDVLEQRLAARRAVIQGAGHAVQFTGKPFNERLATFLTSINSRA